MTSKRAEPRVYSAEQKYAVLEECKTRSVLEVSRETGISQGLIYTWRTKLKEAGSLETSKSGRKSKRSNGHSKGTSNGTEIVQVKPKPAHMVTMRHGADERDFIIWKLQDELRRTRAALKAALDPGTS